MRRDQLHFDLPEAQIARVPAGKRDEARLLAVDLDSGRRVHGTIADFPRFLRANDLVVVNDVRVAPARIHLRRSTGGAVEGLLLAVAGDTVRVLLDGKGRLAPGEVLTFEEASDARLRLVEREREHWIGEIQGADPGALLERAGHVPIPPYIRRARRADGLDEEALEPLDRERYQTTFARAGFAVAAPTAGLHLTEGIFAALRARGAAVATLRLEVGPGTFAPIRTEDLDAHRVAAETYEIPAETARAIARAREAGGRVVAVGTTVVRALESAAGEGGRVAAGRGTTELFVKPGCRFRVVDALLTNFHLPESSLLALVAAFAGVDLVLDVYREAVREGYRFYSYGDATFWGRGDVK